MKLILVLLGLTLLITFASSKTVEESNADYEYADEPAPPPKKSPVAARGGLLNRRNPLASRNSKSTTTTTPPPASEEEGEDVEGEGLVEEPVEQPSSTTETPKKFLKGGVVRPFRSNDDLLASLKRRREQAALNKQHAKTAVHQDAEESAPTEEKAAAPSKHKSNGRKRFNSPKKDKQEQNPVNEAEKEDAPAASSSRQARRFNHRN